MTGDFDPRTTDKVERLMDVLERMASHPLLRDRFAMYGGTAINLFMLDVPRLSVDIDATYVGSPSRDEMLPAKPEVERAIAEIARELDFSLELGRDEHAGRTFYLGYRGNVGPDNVKIDFTYLNRVPLLGIERRRTPVREGLLVPTLSDAELAGGKVKAFFGRVKVRDLYDIANLRDELELLAEGGRERLLHKVVLYEASLSAAFPFGFEGREGRFADRQRELEEELHPMLRAGNGKPSLDTLMESASRFVAEWVLPRDKGEREYLERLAAGDFAPTLLFGEGDIATRAELSPEAAWKLANLQKIRSSFHESAQISE